MIFDEIVFADRYFPGNTAWVKAFDYLRSLGPDAPEQDVALDGDLLIGRVHAYETREPEGGGLESHRRYLDIQIVMDGAEGIDWYPRESLVERTPYDEVKDVVFYQRPFGAAPARIDNVPGRFALLYPTDAHMAQMIVGGKKQFIRKAVVKIDVRLLTPDGV